MNVTLSKISSSKTHCLRYYTEYCPKRHIYIQQLYNDPTKHFCLDNRFIWNPKNRAEHYKHKFDYNPK